MMSPHQSLPDNPVALSVVAVIMANVGTMCYAVWRDQQSCIEWNVDMILEKYLTSRGQLEENVLGLRDQLDE